MNNRTRHLALLTSTLSLAALAACAGKSLTSSKPREDYISYWKSTQRDLAAPKSYNIIGDCDGLPRIDVGTAPGLCVGLIYNGENMIMPRGVLAIGNDLWIADMGGWVENRGKIFRIVKSGGSYDTRIAMDAKALSGSLRGALDRPHSLVLGADGKVYVGAATTISRFDPKAIDPASTIEILLSGLPGDGRHPLKNLVFDETGNLYVNIGTNTDNCEGGIQNGRCTEGEGKEARGVIRKYRFLPNGRIDPNYEVVAHGLRNSMSLAIDPETHELYQGENSRDLINKADAKLDDETQPPEELNLIVAGSHYGWPYCYGKNKASPEFQGYDCSRATPPLLLLPAHTAPLSMFFYTGSYLPDWYRGKLIMSFHGYRKFGHRIVAFDRDAQGRPSGAPLNLVFDWGSKGTQPLGTPTGMTMAPDGSVILTEDKNRKILRIAYDPSQGNGVPVSESKTPPRPDTENPLAEEARLKTAMQARLSRAKDKVPAFTVIQSKLINKYCISCHGGEAAPGIALREWDDVGNAKRLLEARDGRAALVVPKKPAESEVYQRLLGRGFPPMPPTGFESQQEATQLRAAFKSWIDAGAPVPK